MRQGLGSRVRQEGSAGRQPFWQRAASMFRICHPVSMALRFVRPLQTVATVAKGSSTNWFTVRGSRATCGGQGSASEGSSRTDGGVTGWSFCWASLVVRSMCESGIGSTLALIRGRYGLRWVAGWAVIWATRRSGAQFVERAYRQVQSRLTVAQIIARAGGSVQEGAPRRRDGRHASAGG